MSKDISVGEYILGKKKPKRRKRIRISTQKKALSRAKGKCERCSLNFYQENITPHFHHKDGNPKNDKLSNLMVVCPNCHSILQEKIERRKKKSKKVTRPSPVDIILG